MHRVESGGSEIRDTQRANSLILVWTAAPGRLSFGPSKTMRPHAGEETWTLEYSMTPRDGWPLLVPVDVVPR